MSFSRRLEIDCFECPPDLRQVYDESEGTSPASSRAQLLSKSIQDYPSARTVAVSAESIQSARTPGTG